MNDNRKSRSNNLCKQKFLKAIKKRKENGTRRVGWAETVVEEGTVRLNENI